MKPSVSLPPVQAVLFDAYGTLFDVYSVGALAEQLFPGKGEALALLWRDKQIDYTRLTSMSQRYRPFGELTRAGYAVRSAANGIEASHAILGITPDLIITDVNMPHMDGYAFVEALKSDKSLPKIPVIFLTSMDDFERGRELGAVGYITKPVRADRLLAVVAEHIPGGAYPIG